MHELFLEAKRVTDLLAPLSSLVQFFKAALKAEIVQITARILLPVLTSVQSGKMA